MTTSLIDLEEKRLKRLPPHEAAHHLMRLPVRRRLEIILERADAEAVVAALPVQDFYFSVKEIGSEDAIPFLALAKVEQLNHLFGLEWWRKDQVQPAKALDWLLLLSRASEEKILAWLYQADFELLVTLFKKWIRVDTAPEDIDPLEGLENMPTNTLDDQFYWEAHYPQYEEFLKRFLSLIFEVHQGFYGELMTHIPNASEVEMEEAAYRFNRGRLEDEAIPDYYDALEIYRAIRPEEISSHKQSALHAYEGVAVPSFAVALIPEKDLLNQALLEIDNPVVMATLQMELASLANKVVVADQIPPESHEVLRQAVDKVAAYVNLGLHLRSAGDLKTAVKTLHEAFLEHLFRLGQAEVAKIRGRLWQVQQRGWLSRWPAGLKCLDAEWLESAELLLQKTPHLLRATPDSSPAPNQSLFRDPRDLFRGRHIVDIIIALGPLFDALHVDYERLGKNLWPEGQIRTLDDVTIGTMIWTAAARFQLERKWEVEPIPVRLWEGLFPFLSHDALEANVRSWVEGALTVPAHRALAEAYLAPLFRRYAEDMAPFVLKRSPDPRLVEFFLFTEG